MIHANRLSAMKAPHGFFRFTEALIQDLEIFKTKEEFYRFAFAPMSISERQEFIDFVASYNAGVVTEADMSRLWQNSHADFYIPDPAERHRFLTEAAERARQPFSGKSVRVGFERR